MFRHLVNLTRHTANPSLLRRSSTLHTLGHQRKRFIVLFGVGIGVTAIALLPPSFYAVYADANNEWTGRSQNAPTDSTTEKHSKISEPDAFSTAIMKNAQTVKPVSPGLGRVDIMTLAANNPIEDCDSIGTIHFSPTLAYHLFGIYDGHSGAATARMLSDMLPWAVVSFLADLYSRHAAVSDSHGFDISGGYVYQAYERSPGEPPDPCPSDEEIDNAIRAAFCDVDELLVHETVQKILGLDDAAYESIRKANGFPRTGIFGGYVRDIDNRSVLKGALNALAPALAGSCALLGVFNSADRSLRVAVTGDSRAVWGRRVPSVSTPGSYTYEAQQLTADQTALNLDEAARFRALHPDEPDLLKNNRALGWGITRAFGDGAMKWSLEVQKRLHEDFLGDKPREICKTPPYFTAEPVITIKEGIQRGDFVVYASDGLWDCLTSEEVVGLVGQWLEDYGIKENNRTSPLGTESKEILQAPPIPFFASEAELMESQSHSTETFAPSQLPVMYPAKYKDKTLNYSLYWRKKKEFVCKDANVAVHLVRNALGGAHTDLREALVALNGPRARRFRDDISVVVVFFD